jgi:transcriptional regulator of met regulon
MHNRNALSADATIINGRTKVTVKKLEINEQTRREQIKSIHDGIVVAQTSHFLKVFNGSPSKDGGDTSQDNAEYYPRNSRLCWCELAGTLDADKALPLSPTL